MCFIFSGARFWYLVTELRLNYNILKPNLAKIQCPHPSSFFFLFKVHFIKESIRESHIDKLPTQLKDMAKLHLADLCQKTATHPDKTPQIYSNFYINQSFSFVSIQIHQRYFGLCPPYLQWYKDWQSMGGALLNQFNLRVLTFAKKEKKEKKRCSKIYLTLSKNQIRFDLLELPTEGLRTVR